MSFNEWLTQKQPIPAVACGIIPILGIGLRVTTRSLSIAMAASVGFALVVFSTFYVLCTRDRGRIS